MAVDHTMSCTNGVAVSTGIPIRKGIMVVSLGQKSASNNEVIPCLFLLILFACCSSVLQDAISS